MIKNIYFVIAVLLLTFTLVQSHGHRHHHKHRHEDSSQEWDEDLLNTDFSNDLEDEAAEDEFCEWHKCDNNLNEPRGLGKLIDFNFLKKFVRNLIPLKSPRMHMRFYLFRREFTECGRELDIDDDDKTILGKAFNISQPTRIIVHGWMSQSRGSFNRDVKNAYLARGDYNVIVADWSASASNLNYFSVVNMIEGFGIQLAKFSQHLHDRIGVKYDDIYIIGHSLGAQIAASAGKRIKPAQYNTIFALDPAGPKFRYRSTEYRIDPTDAKYVESIQTSANFGFKEPTGNATFYPNYGIYQKSCLVPGCSHVRSYKMFAESITSEKGFWGTRCFSRAPEWKCEETNVRTYKMGGEPSSPKSGFFYVETKSSAPFAMGV